MVRLSWCVALIFACVALLSSNAMAERRVALVIGNSSYQYATPLENPKNDAADMAAKLQGLGFEVVRGVDLNLLALRGTVREFIRKLDGADMALFYYAGHGLQVNGENYIAPVDAKLASYIDLDFEALPMNLVLSAMERASKVNLVFLDACRDNPLAENLARSMGTRSGSVGRGLARLGSGVGSLISFATQPGNVALDGTGRNSPFTSALLKHLGTPGQDIAKDLVYVRREVLDATGGKQVPWENSSLTGEVILLAAAKPVQSETVVAPANQKVEGQLPALVGQMELSLWESIKDSEVKELYEAYLEQFPNGTFAGVARVKIALLEARFAQKTTQAEQTSTAGEKRQAEIASPTLGASNDANEIAALDLSDSRDPSESATSSTQDMELIRSVQYELNRIGCLNGRVDGKWGKNSNRALETYARHRKVQLASADPTTDLLNLLRKETSRVCPLVCKTGHIERDGACIRIEREVSKPKQKKRTDNKSAQPNKSTQAADTKKRTTSKAKSCYICKAPGQGAFQVDVCTDGDPKNSISIGLRARYICRKI